MDSSKKNILQEWILHFKEKKNWKGILEITQTSWVYLNPKSLEVAKYIHKTIQQNPVIYFESLDVFQKKSKIKLTLRDWRNANSEINKACAFYVKLILLNENKIASELDLQQYFLEAGMLKNLDAQKNRNGKMLEQQQTKDALDGFYQAKFHELNLLDIRNQDNRKKLLSLDDFDQGIELYYHENKLRILCEKASRTSYRNMDELTEEERNWLVKIPENIKHFPQIKLFMLSYQMILGQENEIFNILEKELDIVLKKGNISKDYLQNFYEILLVYCIFKINQEQYIFAKKYFNICKLMFREEFGYNNGYLPVWRFKNAIKSAAKMLLEKNINKTTVFNEINDFIEEHKSKLLPESKAAIVGYCSAYIAYLKEDFSRAETILATMELPKDEIIKIDSLFLYLFVLLENNNLDEFLRIRDNLREMLYRKDRISKMYIQQRSRAISYISKIQKIPADNLQSFYSTCLEEINKEKNFMGKDWLKIYLHKKMGR